MVPMKPVHQLPLISTFWTKKFHKHLPNTRPLLNQVFQWASMLAWVQQSVFIYCSLWDVLCHALINVYCTLWKKHFQIMSDFLLSMQMPQAMSLRPPHHLSVSRSLWVFGCSSVFFVLVILTPCETLNEASHKFKKSNPLGQCMDSMQGQHLKNSMRTILAGR